MFGKQKNHSIPNNFRDFAEKNKLKYKIEMIWPLGAYSLLMQKENIWVYFTLRNKNKKQNLS